jgi:protein gp37
VSSSSSIEWTDATWNPVTGCSRVSPGCAHCYALELAPKLRRFAEGRVRKGKPGGKWLTVRDGGKASGPAFGVTLHEDVLDEPLRWRRPRRVFVNSMSDLFHEEIPGHFIAAVFRVMAAAPQHTFQVLTKRPERMLEAVQSMEPLADGAWRRPWPLPNVWLGVTIENRRFVDRADLLRDTPAAVRFISAEPLLGPLVYDGVEGTPRDIAHRHRSLRRCWLDGHDSPELDLRGIDWLIAGGESGPQHRRVDARWIRDLRDTARASDVAFLFKQWGGRTPKAGGRELDGRTWDEFPIPDLGAA